MIAIVIGVVIGWLFWGGEPFEATSAVGGVLDEERSNELAAQVDAREQEIARLRKRLKRVHADLDVRDSHVTAAKAAHEEVSDILRQRDSELDVLRNDYNTLVEGGTLPEGARDEALVRRFAELEEDLASTRTQANSLRDEVDRVASQRDSALAERSGLMEERASLMEERGGLITERDGAHDELQAAHQRFAAEVANMGTGNVDADEQLLRVHEELQNALIARDVATGRAAELESAYERVASELADTQGGSDEAAARSQASERELAELARRLQVAEASLSERDESLHSLGQEIINLRSTQSDATVPSDQVDDLLLELSKAQAELARSRQSVSTLRQRVEAVEDENDRLAGDLAKATTDLGSRSGRAAESAAEIERLAGSLTSQSERTAQSLAENEHLVSEIAAQNDRLTESLAENDRLNAELTRLRTGVLGLDERAKKAESELQRAHGELTNAQQSLLTGRTESEAALSALHLELSDARLRADVAHEDLQDLTRDFIEFREATTRQQTSMQALSDRLDRARTSLVGRRSVPASYPDDPEVEPADDLKLLPNITPTLVANLNEFGITRFAEIAGWADADVMRFETMLGEPEGSIDARGWVQAAQQLSSSAAGSAND